MAQVSTSFQLNWTNRWYKKLDRVHAATIKGSPWLKRVRYENTGGEAVRQPFTLYGHRGDSGDLATAQEVSAGEKNSQKLAWLVPYGTYEGSVRIPHRDIALSRKDKDAAARALQFDVDLALKQRGANIVRLWFSNPGHAINGTAATFSTSTSKLTFATSQEVSNLAKNDQIVISANDGSSSSHVLVAGSAVGFVISRDVAAKTVTVSTSAGGSAANPTNWANGGSYFVFRKGEFLPGTNDMLTALQAYLTPAVVTTTLHGVDRSIDAFLCGFRTADASVTGKSIAARIKRTVNEHREQMGYMSDTSEIDCAYINPVDWGQAEEEFRQDGYRDAAKEDEKDGYMFLTVMTANGPLKLISEPQCPRGVIFLLAQGDIVWHTPTGTVAEMVDQDGSIVSRMANSNDLELRPVSYIAAKMGAPFKHARISVTA